MESDVTVKCVATKGMFASEFLVKVEASGSVIWEGAVDKELVHDVDEQKISEDSYIPAKLAAYLISWSSDKKTALVEVASDGLAQGRRFYVSADMVKPQRLPA